MVSAIDLISIITIWVLCWISVGYLLIGPLIQNGYVHFMRLIPDNLFSSELLCQLLLVTFKLSSKLTNLCLNRHCM